MNIEGCNHEMLIRAIIRPTQLATGRVVRPSWGAMLCGRCNKVITNQPDSWMLKKGAVFVDVKADPTAPVRDYATDHSGSP